MSFAIACMSGSFKGVFVHGVLTALEEAGVRADAYACASSSTLPAACAAAGRVRDAGAGNWAELAAASAGMSEVVLRGINALGAPIREALFAPGAARFLVAASRVVNAEAAAVTQGAGARRLGRRLLIDAARGDSSWRDANLEKVLFDTRAADGPRRLHAYNFDEVAYATTRMMHAWDIPASVAGAAYVDASYTTLCPAVEMRELGYGRVAAVATEAGSISLDMFCVRAIPVGVDVIQPDVNLKEFGVDFTNATSDGLRRGFEHGLEKGGEYAARYTAGLL